MEEKVRRIQLYTLGAFVLALLLVLTGWWRVVLLLAAALPLAAPLYYLYCLAELRRLSTRGLEETADFVLGRGALLAGALQKRAEILGFLSSFERPPLAVAEIGRARGGTLALLCRAAAPGALVVSLDLPGALHAGPFASLNAAWWRRPLLRAMAGPGQELHLIDGDSKSPASVEAFRKALGGRRLDLLFIDGDHTFGGVKSDFELYSVFVRPGGVVAFHDIRPGLREIGVEVDRFWREYPLRGERSEFVADPEQISYGIGALRLPV